MNDEELLNEIKKGDFVGFEKAVKYMAINKVKQKLIKTYEEQGVNELIKELREL